MFSFLRNKQLIARQAILTKHDNINMVVNTITVITALADLIIIDYDKLFF
jgi:hypothetical protein